MLCVALLSFVQLCPAMRSYTLLCTAMQCYALLCAAMPNLLGFLVSARDGSQGSPGAHLGDLGGRSQGHFEVDFEIDFGLFLARFGGDVEVNFVILVHD